jgi:hypothetical protein
MIITDSTYDQNVYVKQSDARLRNICIENVKYHMTLCLAKGKILFPFLTHAILGDHYWGKAQIMFDLKSKSEKQIFLDFRGL